MALKRKKTWLSKKRRKLIIENLFAVQKQATVNHYLAAADQNISRRTAERDLQAYPGIKSRGNTRNRIYRLENS